MCVSRYITCIINYKIIKFVFVPSLEKVVGYVHQLELCSTSAIFFFLLDVCCVGHICVVHVYNNFYYPSNFFSMVV